MITNQEQPSQITMNNKTIEYIENYVHLGQIIIFSKLNGIAEIERRIKLAWTAFARQK